MKKILTYIILFSLINIVCLANQSLASDAKVNYYQPNKYEIIKTDKDNRGLVNFLHVYVSRTTDIKSINKALSSQYIKTGIASLQIYYYDDRNVAKNYSKALFSKGISEKEIDKMSKHIVATYTYIQIDGTNSLKIGKDAEWQ
jgi:hypothetical protein